MGWVVHETIGPFAWGRSDPYETSSPLIGTELLRFQQTYDDYHKPWRGGIRVNQCHPEYGLLQMRRLWVTKVFLIKEFRLPEEFVEDGLLSYKLQIKPFGRWNIEANWQLQIERWV